MIYSDYDCECIFYLGIEIRKMLLLEEHFMYIDLYYEKVKEIYEDYKKYDDNSKSLLESIHNYINSNEQNILKQLKEVVEYV